MVYGVQTCMVQRRSNSRCRLMDARALCALETAVYTRHAHREIRKDCNEEADEKVMVTSKHGKEISRLSTRVGRNGWL